MTLLRPLSFAAGALLSSAFTFPALAASSAASSASDSLAASVGSVSGSLGNSSNSSSKTVTAAEGDYRIVEIAAAPDRDGTVRLKLQAVAEARGADGEFFLYLPQPLAEQARLAQGGVVTARSRPYGTEFTYGPAHQAFFLVLADDWYRELQANAVQL
jgi:hypothetical protein